MSDLNQCPTCSNKLHSLVMRHTMIEDEKLNLLNSLLDSNESVRCTKCVAPFVREARKLIDSVKSNLIAEVRNGLSKMPIATIQVPPKWDFDVKGIVTGQSTTGTGVFSEFTSSFTDFFGVQSVSYNNKLQQGELLCLSQIKAKALELGANAVVGVDIDYSELGGGKGMIMVCMAGTAVDLKNMNEVQPEISEVLNEARTANENLMIFAKFNEDFANIN